jgi:tyrosinase
VTFKRQDVWNLGDGWSDPLVWYAKGVRKLRERPLADPTSWRFLAAMHGFDPEVWKKYGYYDPAEQMPSNADRSRYWSQCQHQSWYFLPWHRGYLASFEAIVRAAIVAEGGPSSWALPYWNYNSAKRRANELPPAFAARKMPDGSDNPLLVKQRYGDGTGRIVLDRARDIRLDALGDDRFPGGENAIPPGFGGPKTLFHHGGEDRAPNGGLEGSPHNAVHGLVGGTQRGHDQNDPAFGGLMGWPDQAALDPIFWLHHANIDRLWESWRKGVPGADPNDVKWLDGPAAKPFFVPKPDGQPWKFSARQMLDTKSAELNYEYEELTPLPPSRRRRRLEELAPAVVAQAGEEAIMVTGQDKPAEMIGSNERVVDLSGGNVDTHVRLAQTGMEAVASSRELSFGDARIEPDRVFLKLENVRGGNDAAVFYVYVGLPEGADPEQHPENLAGTLSFFGVSKASAPSGGGGNGLDQVFEITHLVDSLHARGDLAAVENLPVRFVPRPGYTMPLGGLSVGRVTIFRQPQ